MNILLRVVHGTTSLAVLIALAGTGRAWAQAAPAPTPIPIPAVAPASALAAAPAASAPAATAPDKEAAPEPPESPSPAPAPASAPTPKGTTTQLDRVEVTGRPARATYVARDGSTASKLDVEVRDVPASLQTISPQLIRDQAAGQSINAVLHNASGVTQTYGSGTGSLPAVSIRGFDTGGYTLVDGYPRSNGSSYDWSSIERMEILKGPASLLYGMQYNIGGSINVVTKKPSAAPIAEVELEAGSWRHYRGALDLGGPLDETHELRYRFNFAADTSDSFRDAVYDKNLYIAPSIAWRLGGNDNLLLRGDYHDRRYVADPGLPGPGTAWAANGTEYWYPGPARERMGLDLPISQYIGLPWWDRYREKNKTLLLEWEHAFDEAWKVKTGLSPAWTNYLGRYSGFWWDQPVDDDGNALPVVNKLAAGQYGYKTRETPFNIDLTGEFDTAGINHKLLVGYAWSNSRTHDSGPANNTFLVPVEEVGTQDWLTGPRFSFVPDPDFVSSTWRYQQRTRGVYVQDLLSLGEAWKVLVGYRYDKAEGGWYATWGEETFSGDFQTEGGTPRLGVVFQPSASQAWYWSWSRSFNPNYGRLVDGSIPPPELGLQIELGFKQDFADGRANLNIAAYTLKKKNVERCAPQDPDCQRYVLGGEQGSRGLEFDLNGEVLPHYRMTASLTFQSGAKVRRDLPADNGAYTWGGSLPVGTHFPGGNHRLFNVFGVYAFEEDLFKGLDLGWGYNYSSSSEQNLPNDGTRLPGERTLNLYAAYQFSPTLRAQLNINNATNRIAYSSPGWQGWPWLYFANTPRQFVLTLSAKL